MAEASKDKFDHGLDSPKAAHYNRIKKLEDSFLNGKLDTVPPADEELSVPTPTVLTVATPTAPVHNDTVITFIPKSIPLEFTFDLAGDKKLKVKVIALQVNEADEAITVILDKSVEFVFPVLQPFYITSHEGVIHKVCYAGGTCQIGPCKFVSFIKTE